MKKITSELSSKKQQYGSIIATVCDKHGNVKQSIEQSVDSFNRQLWRIIFRWSRALSTTSAIANAVKLSGNTESTLLLGSERVDGSYNQYKGIVLGSGTTPTGIDTVTMQNLTVFSDNNTTSGALHALETLVEFDDATGIATVSRSFINLVNGSTVNVNEIGIANTDETNVTGDNVAFLTVRDVLNSTISVGYEETLFVQYKLRIFNGTNNYTNIVIRNQYGVATGNAYVGFVNSTGSLLNVRSTVLSTSSGIISNESNVRQGLIFGTGNTAFAKTQLDLATPIHTGNSAGQLFYHPTSYTNISENSTTNSLSWTLTRPIENRSGSNITISEVGLFTSAGTSTNSRFMIDRRVLDAPVTVTNGNTVTFTWEFCYTV
jgi:hypothetical protein